MKSILNFTTSIPSDFSASTVSCHDQIDSSTLDLRRGYEAPFLGRPVALARF